MIVYSKQRLLTQHVREFLQVWPGPLPDFQTGPRDKATADSAQHLIFHESIFCFSELTEALI